MDWLKDRLNNTHLDIVGWSRPAAILSIITVIASWIVFFVITPNWGIDFEGGSEIVVEFSDDVDIGEMRDALATMGLPGDAVQTVGGPETHQFSVRIKEAGFGMEEVTAEVRELLVREFGEEWIVELTPNVEVGAVLSVEYAPGPEGRRVDLDQVRGAVSSVEGLIVQEGRGEYEVAIRVPGLSERIEERIQQAMGEHEMRVLSVESVGPKVGDDLRQQGIIAVVATLGLVLLYIMFRFDLTFAPGAVLALIHDVSITVGIFVLLGREFNLPIIGALLTIVGYSLNDTIVIFDRIRENMERYRRKDMAELINVSISETLSRTVATSFTTFLAIASFLFLGGSVIQDFALAMACGIVFGTYSTMYVATPTILVMEKVKPRLMGLVNLGDGGGDDDTTPEGELTESEKRRRARARIDSLEQA